MPDAVLLSLLAVVMFAPTMVCVVVAVILRHTERGGVVAYCIGAFPWLALIATSIGLNVHAYSLHPEWWRESPHLMTWIAIAAGILTIASAVYVTVKVLPDLKDA